MTHGFRHQRRRLERTGGSRAASIPARRAGPCPAVLSRRRGIRTRRVDPLVHNLRPRLQRARSLWFPRSRGFVPASSLALRLGVGQLPGRVREELLGQRLSRRRVVDGCQHFLERGAPLIREFRLVLCLLGVFVGALRLLGCLFRILVGKLFCLIASSAFRTAAPRDFNAMPAALTAITNNTASPMMKHPLSGARRLCSSARCRCSSASACACSSSRCFARARSSARCRCSSASARACSSSRCFARAASRFSLTSAVQAFSLSSRKPATSAELSAILIGPLGRGILTRVPLARVNRDRARATARPSLGLRAVERRPAAVHTCARGLGFFRDPVAKAAPIAESGSRARCRRPTRHSVRLRAVAAGTSTPVRESGR